MAELNPTISISVEARLHSTFRKFAQEIADQYGVKIVTVDFDWGGYMPGSPVVRDCRVLSTTSLGWSPKAAPSPQEKAICPKCHGRLDPPEPIDDAEYCPVCGYVG